MKRVELKIAKKSNNFASILPCPDNQWSRH